MNFKNVQISPQTFRLYLFPLSKKISTFLFIDRMTHVL